MSQLNYIRPSALQRKNWPKFYDVPSLCAAVKKLARSRVSGKLIFVLLPGLVINLICFSLSPARHIFYFYIWRSIWDGGFPKKMGAKSIFQHQKARARTLLLPINQLALCVCVCELRENAQTQCGKSTLQKLLKNKQLSDARNYFHALFPWY